MGTSALPDMYAESPRATGLRAEGIHISHAHVITNAKQKHPRCKKSEAKSVSSYSYTHLKSVEAKAQAVC